MSARTWSPLLFPYNWQLSKLRYFKLMHYATSIIAIWCKFKYSTCTTLNVNSARVKLNKKHKTECSAKQRLLFTHGVDKIPYDTKIMQKCKPSQTGFLLQRDYSLDQPSQSVLKLCNSVRRLLKHCCYTICPYTICLPAKRKINSTNLLSKYWEIW